MGKNKSRNNQKKKQKRAVREATRRALQRKANEAVRKYSKMRRQPVDLAKQYAENQDRPNGVALDQVISFAHCRGVGECCKNRPIYVEPSDVWRIMHNDRAREKFGLEVTMDLYLDKDGKPGPLVYQVDKETLLPFCAVHRVELKTLVVEFDTKDTKFNIQDDDQVCPFFEFTEDGTPKCILGYDRLTQCASDPVCRTGRLDSKRRLSGWEYSLIDTPCFGCYQASEDRERNMLVGDWLKMCGMEDRFLESDLYHGFIAWHRKQMEAVGSEADREFFWKMATSMLFDWHRFGIDYLEQPREEVIEHGPSSSREVYLAARFMMEGIINGHKSGEEDASTDTEPDDGAQGSSDQG